MRIRIALSLVYVLVLLVTACAAYQPKDPPAVVVEPVMVAAPPAEPEPAQRQCGKATRDMLRQQKAAEGSILIAFEVSRARRGQVQQLNGQLGSIEALLKKYGCVELSR